MSNEAAVEEKPYFYPDCQQGLDGYIVAEKDGRLLICKLSEEQRIKHLLKLKMAYGQKMLNIF